MGKIINVDFRRKKREFTWDDDSEMRQRVTTQVHDDMKVVLDKICYLTENDREFQEYCAHVLGGISANLQGRL